MRKGNLYFAYHFMALGLSLKRRHCALYCSIKNTADACNNHRIVFNFIWSDSCIMGNNGYIKLHFVNGSI